MRENEIYLGDCLEIMKEIPDKSINMILCDLPYCMTNAKWDKEINLIKLWEQYERIIKDNGAIVLTASQPFTSKLITSKIELFKYELIWEKDRPSGHLNANSRPLKNHENILVFYEKQPVYNPIMTIGEPLHSKGYSYKHKESANNLYNKINNCSEICNARKGKTEKFLVSVLKFKRPHPPVHPTQKPVELFEYLIRTYTNKNDLVLDNCVGSGTTAVACINTKRNFIAIEKEPKYYDIAKQRIEEAYINNSQKLFIIGGES